jgi:hypothetical protein
VAVIALSESKDRGGAEDVYPESNFDEEHHDSSNRFS